MTRQKAVSILRKHWKINPRIARVFGYHDKGCCVLAVHEYSDNPSASGRNFKVSRASSWRDALLKWVPADVIARA